MCVYNICPYSSNPPMACPYICIYSYLSLSLLLSLSLSLSVSRSSLALCCGRELNGKISVVHSMDKTLHHPKYSAIPDFLRFTVDIQDPAGISVSCNLCDP